MILRLDKINAPRWWLGLILVASLAALPAQARDAVAHALHVVGTVTASSDAGVIRRLRRGDEIYAGDRLESAAASSAQLVFSDNARMAVRPDTVVRIVDYRFDADDSSRSGSFISLLEGAIRSITGLIGQRNRSSVVLNTPVATIGVRGTDHETVHLTPEAAMTAGNTPAGTYNRVYSGATVLRSAHGELLLDSGEVGFVAGTPGNSSAPVPVDALPDAVEEMLVLNIPAPLDPAGGSDSAAASLLDEALISAAAREVEATLPVRNFGFDRIGEAAGLTGAGTAGSGLTGAMQQGAGAVAAGGSLSGASSPISPGRGLPGLPQLP